MEYRYATAADAPAMAEIFAANRRDALTEEQRADQGFVQGSFDEAALRGMAGRGCLLTAADEEDHIAGFLALSPPVQMPASPPPVKALLDTQDSLLWQGRPLSTVRWLLYGPVVVDAAWRGHGVARGLFTKALAAASGRADVVVAFIEAGNRPSWRVHVEGFGMTPLGEFRAGGRTYTAVAAAARTPDGR